MCSTLDMLLLTTERLFSRLQTAIDVSAVQSFLRHSLSLSNTCQFCSQINPIFYNTVTNNLRNIHVLKVATLYLNYVLKLEGYRQKGDCTDDTEVLRRKLSLLKQQLT